MEYSNTYIDEADMPPMEEGSRDVPQQYLHEPSVPQHHPIVDEEELLAAQAAADAAVAQQQQHGTPGGVFNNVGQGLAGKNRDTMMQYWQETINLIEHDDHDFKNHQLPLARIKKVMKTDEDVRMISAEAPILFAKGCDVFITELTMRAWIHAEENKRRTLQKSDIAAALTKSDMFDFLIDVVPREEEKPKKSYPPRPDAYLPYGLAAGVPQLPNGLRGPQGVSQIPSGSLLGPPVGQYPVENAGVPEAQQQGQSGAAPAEIGAGAPGNRYMPSIEEPVGAAGENGHAGTGPGPNGPNGGNGPSGPSGPAAGTLQGAGNTGVKSETQFYENYGSYENNY